MCAVYVIDVNVCYEFLICVTCSCVCVMFCVCCMMSVVDELLLFALFCVLLLFALLYGVCVFVLLVCC